MSALIEFTFGDEVSIHPSAVVHHEVLIGNRVKVAANAVLGAEGLEFTRQPNGTLKKRPHLSWLILEDDVEVGANTTVQKGLDRPTIIGAGTKIGPNCNIGHQANIGKHCLITGSTMLAGSVTIGDRSYIGPHSIIRNGVKIGKNAFVGLGSVVTKDVPDNGKVVGSPAISIDEFKQQRKKLKELLK